MMLSNIHYDLIKEALEVLAADRYAMPKDLKDRKEKLDLILETYNLLTEEQSHLTKQS